jgi:uncharacterized protein YecT (DUF1311 family)
MKRKFNYQILIIFGTMLLCSGRLPGMIRPVSAQATTDGKIPGVASPTCAEETQAALNRCASQWSRTAEYLRSIVYQDLFGQLSKPLQVKLSKTEQSWRSFRDIHCQELTQPFQDGSIYPLLYHSCLANLTNDRIANLKGLGETTLTPAATTQRLMIVLNQSNAKNSPGQRQWQRYRGLHCQFEVSHFATPNQAQNCQQRLESNRIRQIEHFQEIR